MLRGNVPSFRFPHLLLLMALGLGHSAASLAEDPLSATGPRGQVLLAEVGASAELTLADGTLLSVQLAAGMDVTSLAALDEGWLLAGTERPAGDGRRLFVMRGDGGGGERLAAPGVAGSLVQRGAVLLARDGRLAGMAWLEGDDARALAVKAAPWKGDGWGAVELVSGRGPGSQVALTGAVLADGSWLLAWAAFDGEDDEIVWARRTDAGWSASGRAFADNSVPDIVPSLAAAGNGALLAWSRLEGEQYRLQLARFERGGWAPARSIAGPGTLYPSFQGGPEGPRLVYLDAALRGWAVAQLDAGGRVTKRAALITDAEDRPLSELVGESVRLRWPGGGRSHDLVWRREP
ncbi:MAG TPA: hypothetical protein VF017_20265 [Thermoanaerobaculia bacterium]|nr:hypothetical protein [Thermoanaerobaculia bacterium]